jgi:putative toxin-antitoxin system antitoxin component (TIGR02293 family)
MASQMTPIVERLRSAAQRTDLDQGDVADLVGADRRTVARWLAQDSEPRPETRRKLLELVAVLELLSGVFQPQAAHDWLFTPNALLEHHKPVELIGDGGSEGVRQVLGLIDALGEGVFV